MFPSLPFLIEPLADTILCQLLQSGYSCIFDEALSQLSPIQCKTTSCI